VRDLDGGFRIGDPFYHPADLAIVKPRPLARLEGMVQFIIAGRNTRPSSPTSEPLPEPRLFGSYYIILFKDDGLIQRSAGSRAMRRTT
jgi:hypothetical protein